MSKRLSKESNKSAKPQFQEPSKEDIQGSKSQVTEQDLDQSQLSQQQQQQQSQQQQQKKSSFDLPTVPKFQTLPLREYFDAKLSAVLLEGLKEMGRVRPENPTKFLGEYLIKESGKS